MTGTVAGGSAQSPAIAMLPGDVCPDCRCRCACGRNHPRRLGVCDGVGSVSLRHGDICASCTAAIVRGPR